MDSIARAAKALETARQQFDYVESSYFEHRASESALREAHTALKDAEAALERAHLAAA